MGHSLFTNLGSNQDPDDWHAQKIDREREAQHIEWEKFSYEEEYQKSSSNSIIEPD